MALTTEPTGSAETAEAAAPAATGVPPAVLTAALHTAGVLARDDSVRAVTPVAMTGGFLSETVRLTLDYDRTGGGAPRSLVAKFPARNDLARGVASFLGLYEREVRFYDTLAPRLGLRIPRCYLASFGPDGEFTLLLEDVAGAEMHDQDLGCGPLDARLALASAARLHAALWNDPALADLPWLNRYGQVEATLWQDLYRQAWPAFVRRDGVHLDPELVALGDLLAERDIRQWLADTSGPVALTHTDFHLGNLLFTGGDADSRQAVVLDWQLVAAAPPLMDVAFFLGRLPVARRRAEEEDLLRFYFDTLRDAGVRDYAWSQCRADYQRWTWFGVLSAIVASAAYPLDAAELPRHSRKVARFLTAVADADARRFLA